MALLDRLHLGVGIVRVGAEVVVVLGVGVSREGGVLDVARLGGGGGGGGRGRGMALA